MKFICLVEASLPGGAFLPRDAVLPEHQVHGAIRILHWPVKLIMDLDHQDEIHLAMNPKG